MWSDLAIIHVNGEAEAKKKPWDVESAALWPARAMEAPYVGDCINPHLTT